MFKRRTIYDGEVIATTAALRDEKVLVSAANLLTLIRRESAEDIGDAGFDRVSDELALVAAWHGASPEDMAIALYREQGQLAEDWSHVIPPPKEDEK